MRVSSQQIFRQGIENIADANANTQRLQQQIASGKQLLSPADDPVAATRILKIESELGISEQYVRNIDLAENRLQLIEGSTASVENVILRVRELVLQAGNGALTNQERAAISVEIDERLGELTDLLNTRDADGDYIFGGFDTSSPPFVGNTSGFEYTGDEGVRQVQISNSSFVAISESGDKLFGEIPVVNNQVIASSAETNTSGVSITATEISDQALFDTVFPEDYVFTFGNINNVAPPGPNYTVTRRSDGAVQLADQAFDPVAGIDFNGISLRFNGAPNQGEQYIVQSTNTSDILSTVQNIAANVAGFIDTGERDQFIADAINNIDAIQDALAQGRSRIGARLNTIDSTRSTLEAAQISNQKILSEIRDLDFAEAISNLSFQSFVLEAAQQSFVRVSGLSLFNFLR